MSRECRNHHHACDCREEHFMKILKERDALREEVTVLRKTKEKTATNELLANYCALLQEHLEEHMKELERMKDEFEAVKVLGIPVTIVEDLGDNVLLVVDTSKEKETI